MIIMSSCLICIFMFINLLLTICTLVAKHKNKKIEPDLLSSDEEDDKLFLEDGNPRRMRDDENQNNVDNILDPLG